MTSSELLMNAPCINLVHFGVWEGEGVGPPTLKEVQAQQQQEVEQSHQQQQIALLINLADKQAVMNTSIMAFMEKIDLHMQEQLILIKKMNGKFGKLKIDQSGRRQHHLKLDRKEKQSKLIDLLAKLEHKQVVIFVKSVSRCTTLCAFLTEQGFPALEIQSQIPEEERLERYKRFKEGQVRTLVATDLLECRSDIERVNIIFNYNMPEDTDTYFRRVARAGRLGTKGLAITFVVNESDEAILQKVKSRFEVQITEMPDAIDAATYIENR